MTTLRERKGKGHSKLWALLTHPLPLLDLSIHSHSLLSTPIRPYPLPLTHSLPMHFHSLLSTPSLPTPPYPLPPTSIHSHSPLSTPTHSYPLPLIPIHSHYPYPSPLTPIRSHYPLPHIRSHSTLFTHPYPLPLTAIHSRSSLSTPTHRYKLPLLPIHSHYPYPPPLTSIRPYYMPCTNLRRAGTWRGIEWPCHHRGIPTETGTRFDCWAGRTEPVPP